MQPNEQEPQQLQGQNAGTPPPGAAPEHALGGAAEPVRDPKKTHLAARSAPVTSIAKSEEAASDDEVNYGASNEEQDSSPPTMLARVDPIDAELAAPAASLPVDTGARTLPPESTQPAESAAALEEELALSPEPDHGSRGEEGSHVLADDSLRPGESSVTGVVQGLRVPDSMVLGSDVIEAQPASAISRAVEGSSIVMAELASGVTMQDADVMANEFPLSRPPVRPAGNAPAKTRKDDEHAELVTEEDAGTSASAARRSDDYDPVGEDRTTVSWEAGSKPRADTPQDQTVAFDSAEHQQAMEALFTAEDADLSSSVDLGKHASRPGSSSSGIDRIAEALESGADLDLVEELERRKRAKTPKDASVEFDELLTEEGEDPSISSGVSTLAKTERSDDDDALDWRGPTDDANGGTAETAMTVPPDDDDQPKKKKKDKAAQANGTKAPVVVKKSGGALAWMGGMAVGMLLLAGASAGVWYTQLDLVKQAYEQHPSYVPPPKPPTPPQITNMHRAGDAIAKGEYDQALAELKSAPDTDAARSARANAIWLKYVREQRAKNQPLNKDDAEVQQALQEAGGNTALLETIQRTLNEVKLQSDFQETEQAFKNVREALEKSKIIDDTTDRAELPKAIGTIVKLKQDHEKKIEDLGAILADRMLIEDKTKLEVPVFQAILVDLDTKKKNLESVNKLLKDANVKDTDDRGVKEILDARADAVLKVAEVNKVLEEEKVKDLGARGVKELADQRTQAAKERDALGEVVKVVVGELADAKIISPDGDPLKLAVEGTKLIRRKAESPLAIPVTQLGSTLNSVGAGAGEALGRAFDFGKLTAQLAFYQAREAFIQTPPQKLDNYVALLSDRSRKDPVQLDAIVREMEWITSPQAGASPGEKARAYLVIGLARRNQDQFAPARDAFKSALQEAVQANDEAVAAAARTAQQELIDPLAYFVPAALTSQSAGNLELALANLAQGLKAMPDNASILTHQAAIRLIMARANGKVSAEDAKAIRSELETASKDARAQAEAAFVLGQLEESLNNFEQAEKQYRLALQAGREAGVPESDLNRYRFLLGRILQRERAGGAAPFPPAAPAEKNSEKNDAEKSSRLDVSPVHPLAQLLTAAAIGAADMDEFDDPAGAARLKESLEIADELIRSPDLKTQGQGHVLKALALSKLGRRTEGLREITAAMQLLYPGIETKDLARLVEEHPAFQVPDTMKDRSPMLAERHFADGLHAYWSKDYAAAERQFQDSIKFYDQDARYYYFLALAQLQQKTKLKRDAAYFSFDQGARLEARGAPSVAEINASLERIQGPLRQLIADFRFKAGAVAAAN